MKYKISLILAILMAVMLPGFSASSETISRGNYYALLIGNEKYKHWDRLDTPHEDIDDLANILSDKYGFRTEVLKEVTRNEIIDAIERYKNRLSKKDRLLIYYAGHGTIRQDGGYWVGIDATKTSSSGWLHIDAISRLIDARGGNGTGHIIVIADSCYSGAILRSDNSFNRQKPDESRAVWLKRMVDNRARTAWVSGGLEPVIDRVGNNRNSIFASELIDALKRNTDIIESSEIHEQIKEEVHARAVRVLGADAQAPDYGHIGGTGHAGGDFIFWPVGAQISELSLPALEKDQGGFGIVTTRGGSIDIPGLNTTRAQLRFFESGSGTLSRKKRVYANQFKQDTTRYVSWELDLEHLPPGKTIEFEIEDHWYRPDGTKISIKDGASKKFTTQQDWTYTWPVNSWGSKKAGNAFSMLGKYRVELFINRKKTAVGYFEIQRPINYISALDARVLSLRFYESDADGTPRDSRLYAQKFSSAKTRYINWELNLEHPPSLSRRDFLIDDRWFQIDGVYWVKTSDTATWLDPSWTTSYHSNKLGWKEPGQWNQGQYRVDIYVKGKLIASGYFSITQ